ncbi:MAG: TIGR03364 family FAD-dependent oxidoreductase [Pirellulales bacterium]
MANRDFDVVVVGAGVIGVFHAYAAAQRGLRTALLEQDDLPREASVRNFGMCVPSGMQPGRWHGLAERSAAIYHRLAEAGAVELQRGGTLYVAETELEAAVAEQFARLAPSLGYRCRLLTAAETVALNPAVRPTYARAGLLFAEELRFEANHMLPRLITWLVERGDVAYFPRRLARRVEATAQAVSVITEQETFRGQFTIICNGARVRDLLPQVFAGAELTFCKLQMLRTAPQPQLQLTTQLGSGLSLYRYPAFQEVPAWEALHREMKENEYARRGIHLLAAQDADGRIVLGDSHSYSSQRPDESRDARTDELILDYARRMLDLPTMEIEDRWCGIYTEREDAEPFRTAIDERIHILTAVGGRGMTCGPALAEWNLQQIIHTLNKTLVSDAATPSVDDDSLTTR